MTSNLMFKTFSIGKAIFLSFCEQICHISTLLNPCANTRQLWVQVGVPLCWQGTVAGTPETFTWIRATCLSTFIVFHVTNLHLNCWAFKIK